MEILFKESQKTDSIWPLSIAAIVLAFNWWLYFRFGYTDMTFFYLCLIIVGSLSLFLSILRLDTEITTSEFRYKLYPFSRSWSVIPLQQISGASIRKYNVIKEFGGRGSRNRKAGRAITIAGNQGIQLTFKDKHTTPLLIGTQKPEEIREVIAKIGWK